MAVSINMLNGIKVIDFTRFLPGPYCSMLMGDMGAEVIKVEQPGTGDYARRLMKGMFYAVNRNKKSITINLKTTEGKAIIRKLVRDADVVLEGFSPGVAEKIGIGYETLKNVNPKIIYCSISGFGQTGPYRDLPGHDINYLGFAGTMSIPGGIGQLPQKFGLAVSDLAGGMFAIVSILSSLLERIKTGRGQYIDVSITESVLSWTSTRLGEYMLAEGGEGNFSHLSATNDIYETSDGKRIAIVVIEEQFWPRFCQALGQDGWLQDPRFNTHANRAQHGVELRNMLTKIFKKNTAKEWVDILEKNKVPVSHIHSPRSVFSNNHFVQREMIQEVEIPHLERKMKQISFPVKFGNIKNTIKQGPPALGENNEEVLQAIGYKREEIVTLKERNII